VPGHWPLHD